MGLKCLLGMHKYGFYGRIHEGTESSDPNNDNDCVDIIQVQLCERECERCGKIIKFRRKVNTSFGGKWKRV